MSKFHITLTCRLLLPLFLCGCAEQNLTIKQNLLDQEERITSLENQIAQAVAQRDQWAEEAATLEREADAAKAEADEMAEVLEGVSSNLEELKQQVENAESDNERGYDNIELKNGERIICIIQRLEALSLSYQLPNGEIATKALQDVRSISFRHEPIPKR